MDKLEEWVRPKAEAWDHGVRILYKIEKRYPQSAYSSLGVSLQLKWHNLKRTARRVGYLMGPIKDDLEEAFFPALLGGEEVSADLREILGHSVKLKGLGIPDPQLSAERAYKTSKAASKVLV